MGKPICITALFLALVRLPTAMFGTWADGRLTRLSMVAGFYLLCAVVFRFVVRVRQVMNIDVAETARWRPGLLIAVVATSPVLALGGDSSVYYETELWAFVFLLLTFTTLLAFIVSPTQRHAVVAIIAVFVTVHTRASIGFGALAALVLTGVFLWTKNRKWTYVSFSAAAAIFATHIAVNYAKFGTWLNLPGDKQVLTLLDPNRAQWFAEHNNSFFSLSFLPTTLFHYLRPDVFALERLVPFVRFGTKAREFGVDLESYTPSSSLTASATALLILAVVGAFHCVKKKQWLLMPLVFGGLVAALPTLAIGFIANRYLVDLLPIFVVLATVAVLTVAIPKNTTMKVGVVALLTWGLWVNVSLAAWLGNIDNPGFTQWRYGIDNALFDDAPPSVVAVGRDVPRDGVIGIDGDCDGLYISIEGRWSAIELAEGRRQLTGTVNLGDGTEILVGPNGSTLLLEQVAKSTYRPVFVWPDGTRTIGESIEIKDAVADIRIVSDPTAGWVERGLRVAINDVVVLISWDTPDLTHMAPQGGVNFAESEQSTISLCEELQTRVGR